MSFQVSDPALQLLKDTLISTRTDELQVLRIVAQNNDAARPEIQGDVAGAVGFRVDGDVL